MYEGFGDDDRSLPRTSTLDRISNSDVCYHGGDVPQGGACDLEVVLSRSVQRSFSCTANNVDLSAAVLQAVLSRTCVKIAIDFHVGVGGGGAVVEMTLPPRRCLPATHLSSLGQPSAVHM